MDIQSKVISVERALRFMCDPLSKKVVAHTIDEDDLVYIEVSRPPSLSWGEYEFLFMAPKSVCCMDHVLIEVDGMWIDGYVDMVYVEDLIEDLGLEDEVESFPKDRPTIKAYISY